MQPGDIPPHLASQSQLLRLRERVQQKYGSFGNREDTGRVDLAAVMADTGLRTTIKIVAAVFFASLAASFVASPEFEQFRLDVALVAFWGPVLYLYVVKPPLWSSARVFLTLALFIEPFSEAMFVTKGEGGYWNTVLWPASVAFYGTIKEWSGAPGASLSLFTVVAGYLVYRAVGARKKPKGYVRPPDFARFPLQLFAGAMALFVVIGVVRGAPIEPAFRQTYHMMQVPLAALLFLHAIRTPHDLPAIGTIFVVAAVARSLLVAYIYFFICVPNGIAPEWCTNHSDTVLFVTALLILVAHGLEQRKGKVILKCLAIGTVILAGIALNNRRLAFVSLGAAPVGMYLALKPSPRKTKVTILMTVLSVLAVAYVSIGSQIDSPSPLLKPARAVVSVMEQRDSSSKSRDIENENLIYTLKQSPLIGTGFGFEYKEEKNAVDLGVAFKDFKLIAHNGVLWIWSLLGVVGFTALWILYPTTATLAVRGYRAAKTPLERSASLASLGAVVVCIIQIWGDQGFLSYTTLVTFGVAYGVSARLAEPT
ncbi:MAG: O-antigen ligase family protein [Myxococcales bacterium]|nr:O-antigen ligase family protein [Myxococcales bacterium]